MLIPQGSCLLARDLVKGLRPRRESHTGQASPWNWRVLESHSWPSRRNGDTGEGHEVLATYETANIFLLVKGLWDHPIFRSCFCWRSSSPLESFDSKSLHNFILRSKHHPRCSPRKKIPWSLSSQDKSKVTGTGSDQRGAKAKFNLMASKKVK